MQIVRFDDYQTRSNENRIKLVPIPPSRGIIYDRNGTPLALNRTIYQLEMMPEKVDNVQQTLDALRDVVDLTDDEHRRFQKGARPLPSFYLDSGKGQPQRSAGGPLCPSNQYRFPGVEVKGYKRRYYPYNSALTHVIGYVSKINDKDVDRLDKRGQAGQPTLDARHWEAGYRALLRGRSARSDRLRKRLK
ncbi:penicillin-binding protein 2 (PBP-2) [Klebsiella pneumoniae]|uniref:Penicillin-binding protein 2 (PBP-2) n=1 Tax=Klebsiella pneumoniae TaxID=573 RepID=A0A377W4Q4_KLEPN|nr:penicillin-binding protein 2 (PBP-2) [Klebsiella pneumoniae]